MSAGCEGRKRVINNHLAQQSLHIIHRQGHAWLEQKGNTALPHSITLHVFAVYHCLDASLSNYAYAGGCNV
eukprot:1156147-Pelagomonas_calceolata.AAC.2